MLRLVIVRICERCLVNLSTISTVTDCLTNVDPHTNRSSFINATNIGIIHVFNCRVFYFRILLLRVVCTDVDYAMRTEGGTDLDTIIIGNVVDVVNAIHLSNVSMLYNVSLNVFRNMLNACEFTYLGVVFSTDSVSSTGKIL